MYIKRLSLSNFRNYKSVELEFSPNVNIILGENAQGKTNLVESLYVLGFGKSFRTSQDKDLICMSELYTHIDAEIEKMNHPLQIEFKFNQKQKKEIKINGVPLKKLSELIGELNVVIFSPEDLQLIKGTPAVRRKYMDKSISQIYPYYYKLLVDYNKVLKQRNNLLKQKQVASMIDIWDEQLSDYGAKIMKYRLEFLEELKKICFDIHYSISQEKEHLKIDYQSNYLPKNLGESDVYDKIYSGMLSNLKNRLDLDIRRGYTSVGPHRDDLVFYINDREGKKFGSQGQVRTTALSLKLSEISIIEKILNEHPILILDDVLSELDQTRQNQLISYISDIQTFVTTTEINSILESHIKDANIINIKDGNII
ncbi:DNA replication/repair protein RecF [Acidaminobacter sp. JC074]|uniref:DNA replication/repair protein RecF n=1 Tax=Acidaminobacter sp. JC074 TaxID=2530199 RepID=UPI001F0F4AA8|nr:DNA replication/repair protein RecF [Acidaminobacter sp. JC074]MCH4891224.1 DNA replication/repair protein RecF [Acidaminobacter sp. JC074]